MVAVLGSIGLNVLSSRVKVHAQEEVRYQGVYVLQTILDHIEDSEEVYITNATSSSLTLSMPDPLSDPTVITLEGGAIVVTEGAFPARDISGPSVEITDLVFSNGSVGEGGPSSIAVQFNAGSRETAQQHVAPVVFKTAITKRTEP